MHKLCIICLQLFILLPYLVLSACALKPPVINLTPSPTATSWQANGTLGINTLQNNFSLRFRWQQCGENSIIHFFSPLGIELLHVNKDSSGITLQLGHKITHTATPDTFFANIIGVKVPISELVYWVRGLPSPRFPVQQTGQNNSFIQNAWLLEITRDVAQHALPQQIKFSSQVDKIKGKVVITQWQSIATCEMS